MYRISNFKNILRIIICIILLINFLLKYLIDMSRIWINWKFSSRVFLTRLFVFMFIWYARTSFLYNVCILSTLQNVPRDIEFYQMITTVVNPVSFRVMGRDVEGSVNVQRRNAITCMDVLLHVSIITKKGS